MSETKFQGKVITRTPQSYRKHPKITALAKMNHGQITDLSGNHKIELQWDLNPRAKQDKVFKMLIDGVPVYIDLEELTYYTRVMF